MGRSSWFETTSRRTSRGCSSSAKINTPPPPPEKKDDKPVTTAPGTPPAQQGTQPSGDPDEPPKDAVADYQLLRAVDLIKGISLYSSRAN